MKVDKKTLEDISKWFKSSGLSSATIEVSVKGDFKVTLNKEMPTKDVGYAHYPVTSPPVPHHISQAPAPVASAVHEAPQNVTSTEVKKDTQEVSAPIVGTFYRSAGPDTPPFVQEGDKMKKGDVLCIIEAMKVMNEFEAEYDMEIVSILVENSHLVEYGQALFEVRAL